MKYIKTYDDGVSEYHGFVTLKSAGIQGIAVKVQPAWDLFVATYPEYRKWK